MDTEDFDYIIVGAGTAGSVLAKRLSADGSASVLVLEAGGAFIPADVDDATAWYRLLGSSIDWGYQSVPQPGLGDRSTHEPRGKAPGGSSNLYIMMHVRGHPSDFDNWAYQGAAGWSHQDLLPYFAKLEAQEDQTSPQIGTDGPQRVTHAGKHEPNPLSEVFLSACDELGFPRTGDFNGESMLGAGWHHIDVVAGRRQGALQAYLEPALGRANLTVRVNAQTTELLWSGARCTGVRYLQNEQGPATGPGRSLPVDPAAEPGIRTARASTEVIICAGAIESPKLLLLSGVGSHRQLAEHGIRVVADLPGVGRTSTTTCWPG